MVLEALQGGDKVEPADKLPGDVVETSYQRTWLPEIVNQYGYLRSSVRYNCQEQVERGRIQDGRDQEGGRQDRGAWSHYTSVLKWWCRGGEAQVVVEELGGAE